MNFANPNNLSAITVMSRLQSVDAGANCLALTITTPDGVLQNYLSINTMLPSAQVVDLLSTPATQAELLAVSDSSNNLTTIRAEYQTMITRLNQIQIANNPTNAQIVQAIKDVALYEERILKAIKRLSG